MMEKKAHLSGGIDVPGLMGPEAQARMAARCPYMQNRELSWLTFNERVLDQGADETVPLLERLQFVSIFWSNLQEFFMVRVASLVDMAHAGYKKKDLCGMTAGEQLDAVRAATHDFVDRQYSTLNRSLLTVLEKNGIKIVDSYKDLTGEQSDYVDTYFKEKVFPVLTPMAVDASRPFPHIANKSLNIAALITPGKNGSRLLKDIEKQGDISFATVTVPSGLPRLVALPADSDRESAYIFLEQIIEKNMSKLFLNYNVICTFPYRVMRNADFELDEE